MLEGIKKIVTLLLKNKVTQSPDVLRCILEICPRYSFFVENEYFPAKLQVQNLCNVLHFSDLYEVELTPAYPDQALVECSPILV